MRKDKEWLKEQLSYLRKAVGESWNPVTKGYNAAYDNIAQLIDQLDEPEKVVIPQFVAEFVEWKRTENLDNWKMASAFISHVKYQKGGAYEWSQLPGNMDIFLSGLINGYEVEKPKTFTFEVNAFEEIVIQADSEEEAKCKAQKEWQHRFEGMFGGVELIGEVEE